MTPLYFLSWRYNQKWEEISPIKLLSLERHWECTHWKIFHFFLSLGKILDRSLMFSLVTMVTGTNGESESPYATMKTICHLICKAQPYLYILLQTLAIQSKTYLWILEECVLPKLHYFTKMYFLLSASPQYDAFFTSHIVTIAIFFLFARYTVTLHTWYSLSHEKCFYFISSHPQLHYS